MIAPLLPMENVFFLPRSYFSRRGNTATQYICPIFAARTDSYNLCIADTNQPTTISHYFILTMADHNQHTPPPSGQGATPFAQTYFHGTKANLQIGDFIQTGFSSNYGHRKYAKYIFLSATLDAAIWGAELAVGDGRERIYLVEPTGLIEDDPDLTDKKYQGNPTQSYRSESPFRVVGEVSHWQPHAAAQVQAMKDALQRLHEQNIQSLNDAP